MKTLTAREYELLDVVQRTSDFDNDDEDVWVTFEALEDQGLVGWHYGPLSRELDEEYGPDATGYGEGIDVHVTAQGQIAMTCYRLVHAA